MFISEIFYSVQGEGVLTGVPSMFIRTSGCNLRCRWCDTGYASWKPEGSEMNVAEILAVAEKWPARHVVLTGGEPMVAKGIRELAQGLRDRGMHITIETAGTIAPEGIACDLASVSPKLSHSTPRAGEIEAGWIERHEQLRWQPEVLKEWLQWCGDWQLKFVVSAEADVEEIRRMLHELEHDVTPERVLLMPEGRTAEELRSRSDWLVGACLRTGFRFCQRLHIDLWGNRRGV